jgi:GAF domain-containing protein
MPGTSNSIERDYSDPGWKLLDAARERLRLTRTLPEIVEIVRATARSVASADGVTFVLRENDQCHYIDEDAISPLWKGQRFPLTECISGWSMIHGRTAAIEDITLDERIPQHAYRPTFVKSLIMAPAGHDAAIGAYWRDRRAFTPREVALIEALAAAVADAMEKAKAA